MRGSALVLGAGGVTGVAWELGILAGLARSGVDLTGAELLVGTSAGSVVAAQVATGIPLADLYTAQLREPGAELAAQLPRTFVPRVVWATLRSREAGPYAVRMGRLTRGATPAARQRRRAVIASRLPEHDWPRRRLLITAVDVDTGEFAVFDRDSGVDLVDAVGASCAVPGVWPPVTIGGRDYMDGGMRSPANADLAAGYARVVIVAPIARSGGPVAPVARQAEALRERSRVALVVPDRASRRAFGRNVLDPGHRASAARAGYAQAASVATEIAGVWADVPGRPG